MPADHHPERPADKGADRARVFRAADLARRNPLSFRIDADEAGRAALAADLRIPAIRKLRFEGTLTPEGREDWRLDASLGATVVQDCVVTLTPVTTRIDTAVVRRFLSRMPEPDPGSESEMPEDDTIEPLSQTIDPAAVMAEALALALPDYPRAEGAGLGAAVFAPPGAEPLTDDRVSPFAALARLKKDAPEE